VSQQSTVQSLALRTITLVLAGCLLVWTFRDLDLGRTLALLSVVSIPAFALILAPQLLALSLESTGWSEAFAALGHKVSLRALLRVRLSTEALAQTLPAGVVFAESVKPALLRRWCGLPITSAVAGMAARKYLLVLAQSGYVLSMAILGFATLERASVAVIGLPGLPWLVVTAGLVLLCTALCMRSVLSHGALGARLLALLRRLPIAPLRAMLAKGQRGFHETDGQLRCFFEGGIAHAHSGLPFVLLAWLLESLETFVILQCLGVPLDFTSVAAFEVALCFARNVAFFLPSGLGLHDLGYVSFLAALGVADPVVTGAAFMILKRGKEAFWAVIGYTLLATGGDRRLVPLAAEST
jgi:uncharacterized membrane protein YbhN (UPF0104 family)